MSPSTTTRIVWRYFVDYDNEEAWLNDMASQGWNLVKSWLFRYRFEKGKPGEYTYRIQLLPNWATSAKSKEYLAFMEESGVEVVGTSASWVYFRKKNDGEPFRLFSDLDSAIAHQKRVMILYLVIAIAIGASIAPVYGGSVLADRPWLEVPLLIEAAAMVLLAAGAVRSYMRVRALEHRRQVTE